MSLWQCPAVVTGAASGLGAETARHLAETGAKVAVIDIDGERVETVGTAIDALAIRCDVANPEATVAALAEARERHGPARVPVHCVGRGYAQRIVSGDGPVSLDEFRQLVEVNLISTFNMMRLGDIVRNGTDSRFAIGAVDPFPAPIR
jgi:NAD(P)-dependent dehydrogenase (short-subunit alcohol dehydrogenase family)